MGPDVTLLKQRQLLPQEQDLGRQGAAGLRSQLKQHDQVNNHSVSRPHAMPEGLQPARKR
jgi:hypothetical protein